MDKVLNLGVDGWKCDGTVEWHYLSYVSHPHSHSHTHTHTQDPYVFELIWAEGEQGHVTYREYAGRFYP